MKKTADRPAPRGRDVGRALSYANIEQTMHYYRLRWVPELSAVDAFPCADVFATLARQSVLFAPDLQVGLLDEVFDEQFGELGRTYFSSRAKRIVVGLVEGQYDQMECGDGRARYSLCHELGHAALQANFLVSSALVKHPEHALLKREEVSVHAYCRDSEWQADAAAAALLAPADGLEMLRREGELKIDKVAKNYGMSLQAASIRIENFVERADALLKACARAKEKGPSR